jgi:hypothetical protein
VSPQGFDPRRILARDVAGFAEALPDSAEIPIIKVNAAEQADDRHRRLLRLRRHRPRRRAAEKRDELPVRSKN